MSATLTARGNAGRHDHAARDGGAPFYRVWGGQRGRYVVTLYREP